MEISVRESILIGAFFVPEKTNQSFAEIQMIIQNKKSQIKTKIL